MYRGDENHFVPSQLIPKDDEREAERAGLKWLGPPTLQLDQAGERN